METIKEMSNSQTTEVYNIYVHDYYGYFGGSLGHIEITATVYHVYATYTYTGSQTLYGISYIEDADPKCSVSYPSGDAKVAASLGDGVMAKTTQIAVQKGYTVAKIVYGYGISNNKSSVQLSFISPGSGYTVNISVGGVVDQGSGTYTIFPLGK